MVEGSGFELSVPVSKLSDDSFQATFAPLRRVPVAWRWPKLSGHQLRQRVGNAY